MGTWLRWGAYLSTCSNYVNLLRRSRAAPGQQIVQRLVGGRRPLRQPVRAAESGQFWHGCLLLLLLLLRGL